MHTKDQIPATIRELFQPIAVVDEHEHLFSRPTRQLLGLDGEASPEAVHQVDSQATGATPLRPVCRFMMEAQLEALENLFLYLGERHPERFRETERGLDLVANLQILLNG